MMYPDVGWMIQQTGSGSIQGVADHWVHTHSSVIHKANMTKTSTTFTLGFQRWNRIQFELLELF